MVEVGGIVIVVFILVVQDDAALGVVVLVGWKGHDRVVMTGMEFHGRSGPDKGVIIGQESLDLGHPPKPGIHDTTPRTGPGVVTTVHNLYQFLQDGTVGFDHKETTLYRQYSVILVCIRVGLEVGS